MDRRSMADAIVTALATDGRFHGRVWVGTARAGTRVRIYITDCGQDVGYLYWDRDGDLGAVMSGNRQAHALRVAPAVRS